MRRHEFAKALDLAGPDGDKHYAVLVMQTTRLLSQRHHPAAHLEGLAPAGIDDERQLFAFRESQGRGDSRAAVRQIGKDHGLRAAVLDALHVRPLLDRHARADSRSPNGRMTPE